MASQTMQQYTQFPILQYQDILTTLKVWGFMGNDRVLMAPTSDLITKVLELFLIKLGYQLQNFDVKDKPKYDIFHFNTETFTLPVQKNILTELTQQILEKQGFPDLLTILDAFCPEKKRTRKLLSCMIYIIKTKQQLNEEINPDQSKEMAKVLQDKRQQANDSKMELEKLRQSKAASFTKYQENLKFTEEQKEKVQALEKSLEEEKSLVKRFQNGTKHLKDQLDNEQQEKHQQLKTELKTLKQDLVKSPNKLKETLQDYQDKKSKLTQQQNTYMQKIQQQYKKINVLKNYNKQKFAQPIQETEKYIVLEEDLQKLDLQLSEVTMKENKFKDVQKQQQNQLELQEKQIQDKRKVLSELCENLDKIIEQRNKVQISMSNNILQQESKQMSLQTEIQECEMIVKELQGHVDELQQKMDNDILEKSELYKQLQKAQKGYTQFFENAMNSQDYNFSQE